MVLNAVSKHIKMPSKYFAGNGGITTQAVATRHKKKREGIQKEI
jgi:hypothetical protein